MRDPLSLAADAELEALSSAARTLEPTPDNERKWVLRDEAAFLLDGDYARERLGLAGSTDEKLARLSRNLSDRRLLRDAVCSGAVTPGKA